MHYASLLIQRVKRNFKIWFAVCEEYTKRIGSIYYRQHNKQLGVMVFTTTCFDSHKSSSGYVQNLLVWAVLLLTVLEVIGRYEVVAVLTLIRKKFWRSSDIPASTKNSAPVFSCLEDTLHNNLRCVWIVRKLQEYYAVLLYYKYRKRKWSAADASEPNVCRMWNLHDTVTLKGS
jgi:hypothetical protein